jgi:16S rRNA (guanine527-N7)-methyltransferase
MGETKIVEAFEQLLTLHLKAFPHKQLGEAKLRQLSHHFQLLSKWNKAHNLIGDLNLEDLVSNHYMDCILAVDLCSAQGLLRVPIFDLGAGNGFPGVVGAILYPEQEFILVESLRKKCSFLRQVKSELRLSNLSVRQERVEMLREISCAISRAAFSEENINSLSDSFSREGELVLLRGPAPFLDSELNKGSWKIAKELFYKLNNGAQRSLLVLNKRPSST